MITLNGNPVELNHFTDGTLLMKESVERDFSRPRAATVTWTFEDDTETVALMFLTRHLQEHGVTDVHLVMPYIPNARQDRVKTDSDVFTLKYFAEFINNLHFTSVTVLDPHSASAECLIDRIVIKTARKNINEVINRIGAEDLILFFPDEGAMKRYSAMADKPFVYGMKKRNWETREISEMHLLGAAELLPGRAVLMVDDICSSGGTLLRAAKLLKENGAGDIYLYVSHCENIVTQSELLTTDIVKRVFTTASFLTIRHEKIEILDF